MPADRVLSTLLRSLQTYTDQQDTPRLLGTASSLLTTLSNPHNLSLLTTQLLTAPAIWAYPDGLQTCLRTLSVFHSAAGTLLRHYNATQLGESPTTPPGQFPIGGHLKLEEWVRAIVKGADERSERWKHLMVLGGLLIGLDNNDELELATGVKHMLEQALVRAVNLALEERDGHELGGHCVALVLNHSFPMLSDFERGQIDYDRLLPVLVGAAFFSKEGYQSAYFLGPIDPDVIEVPAKRFNWKAESPSFRQIERTMSRPLVTAMGPLSRLISHAVENVQDPWLIQTLMEDLTGFSKTLMTQWRHTKLSEVDASEEAEFLHEDTLKTTFPLLWKLLRSTLFAITIVMRGVLGRMLGDPVLASDAVAPVIVTQALHILRNFYFISSRLGSNPFSQYTFVYLTAIDIAAQYPIQADAFLKAIQPTDLTHIPTRPLDRTLDLYFLNTAEHFTPILPTASASTLLIPAATPYLSTSPHRALIPIFEAAHSVVLAVLCAPRNAPLATDLLPFYIDALFKVFPATLSPRQFRLAFKTLLRVTAPPAPLAARQPDLPAVLLELVHERALHAPTMPLPAPVASPVPAEAEAGSDPVPPLSEQAVLILTLLDALPFLPVPLLGEWLPLCAELVNGVADGGMREACRKRFWEVLVAGEMDPERSLCCVEWWVGGGRERVLFGGSGEEKGSQEEKYLMSGALGAKERENKL